MDLAYLFATLIGAVIWGSLFLFRADTRRVMLLMSALGLPLALSDIFYVPQYWRPHTLGHIPVGIEGFLFSFEAAGICAVIYPVLFHRRFQPLSARRAALPRLTPGRAVAILLPLPISFAISLGLHVNLEWGLYAGLVCAGAYTIAMRNDLLWTEVASAVTFLPVYALALILWLAVFPGVHEWFTLRGLPHWYLLGVPLSEIVFGVLFAAYWSGLYPMLFEQQLVDVRSGSAAQGRRVGGESPKVVPGVDAG